MTEAVEHPAHYGGKDNPYEIIKIIEALDLGFHLGNVLKYVGRPGKGKYLEDLKKARWYLDRKIALEEAIEENKNLVPSPPKTSLDKHPIVKFKLRQQGTNPYPEWFDAQSYVNENWTIRKMCAVVAEQFNLVRDGGYGISLAKESAFLNQDRTVKEVLESFPQPAYYYYLRERD